MDGYSVFQNSVAASKAAKAAKAKKHNSLATLARYTVAKGYATLVCSIANALYWESREYKGSLSQAMTTAHALAKKCLSGEHGFNQSGIECGWLKFTVAYCKETGILFVAQGNWYNEAGEFTGLTDRYRWAKKEAQKVEYNFNPYETTSGAPRENKPGKVTQFTYVRGTWTGD